MSTRTRFVLLTALRWLPTGLVIPVTVLLGVARGLSLGQTSTALAAQGLVVLALELPTGSLTDTAGRRVVFVGSAAVAAVAYLALSAATTFTGFVVAWALMGVFRALDSGPLEAWYVDAERAAGRADRVPSGLSAAGAAVGVSIAVGSLAGGALVQWSGGGPRGLALPFLVAAVLAVLEGVVGAVLLTEPPRTSAPARWGAVMIDGLRLAGRGGALRWFVAAEAATALGMVSFELLTPVRLSALAGGTSAAAAAMGPVSAAAWGAGAAGSALTALVLRRRGPRAVTVGLIAAQAVAVVGLAVAGSAVTLVVAYLLTYLVHLGYGATFGALVHARVDDSRRATALSVLSMAGQGVGAVGNVALGVLSDAASPSVGLAVGAGALGVAALLVHRASRPQAAGPVPVDAVVRAEPPGIT